MPTTSNRARRPAPWSAYGYNIKDWYPPVGSPSWEATMGMAVPAYEMSAIPQPAGRLQFNEAPDWWSKWKGADYIHGWDGLGQLGTVNQYKGMGGGGPTMYRHNGAANLAFYDGHVETRHKTKVWIPEHAEIKPHQPGMWVVKRDVWAKNGGGLQHHQKCSLGRSPTPVEANVARMVLT